MLADWDPMIYQKMIEDNAMEDYQMPMPIFISNYA
jgi:hypothetical protein